MNATEAYVVHIRNWVPGVLRSKSNTCEGGFDCKQPGNKLTAFYCQCALLAKSRSDWRMLFLIALSLLYLCPLESIL